MRRPHLREVPVQCVAIGVRLVIIFAYTLVNITSSSIQLMISQPFGTVVTIYIFIPFSRFGNSAITSTTPIKTAMSMEATKKSKEESGKQSSTRTMKDLLSIRECVFLATK